MLPLSLPRVACTYIEKCDEGRPACGNCLKRKQECPGYRDDFDIMLKDQTASVPAKAKRKQAAKDKKKAQERRQQPEETEHDSSICEWTYAAQCKN